MPVRTLTNQIISGLESSIGRDGQDYNSTTPVTANISIAKSLTEYITANTSILLTYAGVLPNGSPDPIISGTNRLIGAIPPVSGRDWTSWVSELETNVTTSLLIGPSIITPVSPTLGLIKGLVLPQEGIKTTHEGNLEDPQIAVWDFISQGIFNWINSNPGVVTFPATTGASTGVATITKIIIN